MPYVRELVIFPGAGYRPPSVGVRALLGPFNAAIRFGLDRAAVKGPFVKLAIDVYPPADVYVPGASGVVANVAMATVVADLDALAARPEEEARPAVARLVLEGLDLFWTRWPWEDEPVRAVVREMGAGRGPYTFGSSRLTTRDRSTGTTFETSYELSRAGIRIVAVRREGDGSESGRTVVMAGDGFGVFELFDPETGRTFWHARSAIVSERRLQYRDRQRQPITSVPLAAFDR